MLIITVAGAGAMSSSCVFASTQTWLAPAPQNLFKRAKATAFRTWTQTVDKCQKETFRFWSPDFRTILA